MQGNKETLNEFSQPIGHAVPDFVIPDTSKLGRGLLGTYVELEPLDIKHAEDLFEQYSKDDGRMWTYLSYGPFKDLDDLIMNFIKKFSGKDDPKMLAILDRKTHRALGVAAFLRVFPDYGSVEIGHLSFSPKLQRTTYATEALFLMMKNSFDLGFRRCEWKCDALNLPSERAARRLGFRFEGTFRQALVYKGRNRDTKWFSILDHEWPDLLEKFQEWLSPSNFTANGDQVKRLRCSLDYT